MNSFRTAFCGIDTVSCLAGLPHDRVYELVDSGYYLWVWNISSGRTGKRELRFWTREINDRDSVAGFNLDQVLKLIIPKRAHLAGQFNGLRNWELRHLLRISKTSLCKMRKELGICGTSRNLLIRRANVERFFRRRWCGTPPPPGPKTFQITGKKSVVRSSTGQKKSGTQKQPSAESSGA